MEILNLQDNPKYINKVANWLYKEFVESIKPHIKLADIIKSLENHNKESIPMTLIARNDGECVGTISLFENDMKTLDFTPYLGALYVDEKHRNEGIGKQLIDEILSLTRQLGYSAIYLRTEHASKYYEELGWQFIIKTQDEIGLETEVYKMEL
jgi:predicted N-acetyltransferase YhbS